MGSGKDNGGANHAPPRSGAVRGAAVWSVAVPADQLETVAREHGDPVDSAVLANVRAQTTRIVSDQRARTPPRDPDRL
jgi:hypothetical protein